jgi:hypothetical protein
MGGRLIGLSLFSLHGQHGNNIALAPVGDTLVQCLYYTVQ